MMTALAMIDALDHINIETIDLDKSVRFYTALLELEIGNRPAFDAEGVWLYSGKEPLIHLVVRSVVNQGPTGAIHHVAFKARDCAAFEQRLKSMQLSYELFVVPDLNVTQIFVIDPNEVRLELNFYN
jgi:catechol 2,3-dioxygenase-like lactoylglutathione lyase family enzyme